MLPDGQVVSSRLEVPASELRLAAFFHFEPLGSGEVNGSAERQADRVAGAFARSAPTQQKGSCHVRSVRSYRRRFRRSQH